jgi:multimeric flavodoxin WrbA
MNITILNGDIAEHNTGFSGYLEKLVHHLPNDYIVELFNLDQMNLYYCTGCWDCWWKTPGRCKLKDEGEKVFRSVINSDLFIFASPLIAGFTSSTLKKITDRLIVLIHPYLDIRNGESHHKKRYDYYPDFGVIVQKEQDTDEEDLKIVKDMYDRLALNFHAKQLFFKTTDQLKPEEMVHDTLLQSQLLQKRHLKPKDSTI